MLIELRSLIKTAEGYPQSHDPEEQRLIREEKRIFRNGAPAGTSYFSRQPEANVSKRRHLTEIINHAAGRIKEGQCRGGRRKQQPKEDKCPPELHGASFRPLSVRRLKIERGARAAKIPWSSSPGEGCRRSSWRGARSSPPELCSARGSTSSGRPWQSGNQQNLNKSEAHLLYGRV